MKSVSRKIVINMRAGLANLAYTSIFLLLFFTLFTSCKNKWKRTSSAEIQVGITKVSSISYLNFTGGHMLLEELSFTGERKQGKDVSFHYPLSNAKADLTLGDIHPPVKLDIPQGTYTSIELELETREGIEESSILIMGTYTNKAGSIIPIRFEFNSSESFEIEAEAEDGEQEIVLIEDVPAKAKIILNPYYWFAIVSQNMLEEASLTNVSGIPTIVISESSNEDIFDAVVDRIDEDTEAIFH